MTTIHARQIQLTVNKNARKENKESTVYSF